MERRGRSVSLSCCVGHHRILICSARKRDDIILIAKPRDNTVSMNLAIGTRKLFIKIAILSTLETMHNLL